MSYALIEKLQNKAIPVQQSCRVLGVSRAGYYSARSRLAKPLLCKVGVHLKAAFITSGQSYGSRRLVSALAGQGITIGRYKARSLMRRAGLKPVWKRKFIHTTDSKHNLPIAANILAQQFYPAHQTSPSSLTSRTSAPEPVGCIWPRCWICIRARWLGGPWHRACLQNWSARLCRWPSCIVGRQPG